MHIIKLELHSKFQIPNFNSLEADKRDKWTNSEFSSKVSFLPFFLVGNPKNKPERENTICIS